jgi:hypothetical protein
MLKWRKWVAFRHEAVVYTQLFPIIRKSLKVFIIVVSFFVTLQSLGVNLAGLLAWLSIGGLAIGLAAQDTLSNLFVRLCYSQTKRFVWAIALNSIRLTGRCKASACLAHAFGPLMAIWLLCQTALWQKPM